MAKTPAQRAARARRRRNRAAKLRSLTNSVRRVQPAPQRARVARQQPILHVNERIVEEVGPRRRRQRNRNVINTPGPVRGLNYMATDGINSSRVVTNRSTIEDTFQVRREKIGNISGTAAFTVAQSLYINPGNSVLFPIFSQIAATYEEYRINKLEFTFETDAYTATNGTASAGKVILATNFDPDDAQFSSDTQMENYVGSVKGPPYAPIIAHNVLMAGRGRQVGGRGDFSLNNYFVYPSANSLGPGTDNAKFYDAGLFQLATSGNAVTTEIGELYVTYSFTMIRPKQPEVGGAFATAIHISNSANDATQAATMGLTPFSSAVVRSGSTLSIADMSTIGNYTSSTIGLSDSLTTQFNLPNVDATWLICVLWYSATSIAAVPSTNGGGGSAALSVWANDTSASTFRFFLAAGTSAGCCAVFQSTRDNTPGTGTNVVSLGGLTGMTDGNYDLYVVKLPTNLITLPKIKDDMLENRVDYLERMIKSMCSSSSKGYVSDFEPDSPSSLSSSVHIPREVLTKFIKGGSSSSSSSGRV